VNGPKRNQDTARFIYRPSASDEHFHLNPVRKGGQVQSQPIEQLALGAVDSEVANRYAEASREALSRDERKGNVDAAVKEAAN
jgi:hypothetical protein